jgi:hypothetical protein
MRLIPPALAAAPMDAPLRDMLPRSYCTPNLNPVACIPPERPTDTVTFSPGYPLALPIEKLAAPAGAVARSVMHSAGHVQRFMLSSPPLLPAALHRI